MPRKTAGAKPILRDLGDGLILRRSVPADREALVTFNCGIHCRSEHDDPPQVIASWVRDLMSGHHPTFSPNDFTIVEDTRTGEIVSSLNLIPQTWSYAGVPFNVGRPELVGTKDAYRRKGLIRAQFEVVHEWSAERGEKIQFITGIPFFYRQFGYEMTVAMPDGGRGHKSGVPALKRGEKEPCRLRPAAESDLAFIARTYQSGMSRNLLSTVRDAALWRYELYGRREGAMPHWRLAIIEDARGRRLGFLAHGSRLWRNTLTTIAYELKPGASWVDLSPSVLRYLAATGEKMARRTKAPFEWIGFEIAEQHPLKRVVPSFFRGGGGSYAFYLRVPDLPGFLRHVAPVLEERLARSPAAGYTGDLKLSFYRDGLRLAFKRGRLIASEPWRPDDRTSAVFPFLTFLHLVFGHHSVDEIRAMYADAGAWGDTPYLLLETLFPKLPSEIWGLE